MISIPLLLVTLPSFPLNPPASDRPVGEHRAHEAFRCWVAGIQSMTATRASGTGELRSITLHNLSPTCASLGRDLKFDFVESAPQTGLVVLKLTSPAIENTALSAYSHPQLVLSVEDHAQPFRPFEGAAQIPLDRFRVIFNHDQAYDPGEYGQFGAELETLAAWKRTALTLISRTPIDEPGCEPRFPGLVCHFTVSRYRQSYLNSETGATFSSEFESRSSP